MKQHSIFQLGVSVALVAAAAGAMIAIAQAARAEEGTSACGAAPGKYVSLKSGLDCLDVAVPAKSTAAEKSGARLLIEQFRRRSRCPIRLVDAHARPKPAARVRILLGDPQRHGEIADLVRSGRIALPERIDAEGYAVKTSPGNPLVIVIAATHAPGVVFGVGRLLRSLRFGEKHVAVPSLDLVDKPQHRFRAEFLATHMQDNGYKDWTPDQWRAYVDDLAIWGVNQVWYLPMQFGQTNNVFKGKGSVQEQRRWEVYRHVPTIVRDVGLGVGIYIGVNDIFADEMIPGIEAAPGMAIEQNHACPSRPEGWKRIMADREQLFQRMPQLDYCYFPTTDYGGCGCKSCQPWSRTYLKLAKAEAALVHRHHPNCRVVLSTQFLPYEEQLTIARALDERPAWADALHAWGSGGIGDGPRGFPPRSGNARQSYGYPLLIYPEITMAAGWGSYGAHVMVDRFDYNLGDGGFDRIAAHAAGFFCYSEGLHDDLIKVIWAQKGWRHAAKPRDVTAEYCRFHFGEEAAPLAEKAILVMAANWDHRPDFALTGQEVRLVQQAEAAMPAWARESWRTRLLKLRALSDHAKAQRQRQMQFIVTQRDGILRDCIRQTDAVAARARLVEAGALAANFEKARASDPHTAAIQSLLEKLRTDGFYRSSAVPIPDFLKEAREGRGRDSPREAFLRAQLAWGTRAGATLDEVRQAAWAGSSGWIEAEDFLPADLSEETATAAGWKWGSNIAGFSGRGHLVSQGRATGMLSQRLAIAAGGSYWLWVRDHNHQGGMRGTDGSLRLLVSGKPTPPFGNDRVHAETWTWKLLGRFQLSPGHVELTFEDLGDGFSVTDCLLLTPNADYRPEGISRPNL